MGGWEEHTTQTLQALQPKISTPGNYPKEMSSEQEQQRRAERLTPVTLFKQQDSGNNRNVQKQRQHSGRRQRRRYREKYDTAVKKARQEGTNEERVACFKIMLSRSQACCRLSPEIPATLETVADKFKACYRVTRRSAWVTESPGFKTEKVKRHHCQCRSLGKRLSILREALGFRPRACKRFINAEQENVYVR